MNKLYPHELEIIHDTMLELYGGLPGEKDPGMIEYVCKKPFAIVFGHEQYPTQFEKAAVILFSWARGHSFYDGNKRTAVKLRNKCDLVQMELAFHLNQVFFIPRVHQRESGSIRLL